MKKLPERQQYKWERKKDTLAACCATRPDPASLGFLKLLDWKFRTKFGADLKTLLHHMFESRHGETIMVYTAACGAVGAVANVRAAPVLWIRERVGM